MAKYVVGVDYIELAKAIAEPNVSVLCLSAVNRTAINGLGHPLIWNSETWYQFGSMSAGTSLRMAEEYPEVQKWWAETVYKNSDRAGINVSPVKDGNITFGVATVKDVWWQEAPADAHVILWYIEKDVTDLLKLANKFDVIILPMLGCGFGQLDQDQVRPLLDRLPKNCIVCSM